MRKTSVFAALALAAAATTASAQAVRTNAGFNSTVTGPNDDSQWAVTLPFLVNLYGYTGNNVFVSNNGFVNFGNFGSCCTVDPRSNNGAPSLGAFDTDQDTRNSSTNPVTYGLDAVGGYTTFGVNWPGVGHYFNGGPAYYYQLLITDRNDLGAGDFDFEFNYNSLGGYGGCAFTGFGDGVGNGTLLAGSGCDGTDHLADGGSNALISGRLNSTVDGRYHFGVRDGQVVDFPAYDETTTPEPASMVLLATGLVGVAAAARRRKSA